MNVFCVKEPGTAGGNNQPGRKGHQDTLRIVRREIALHQQTAIRFEKVAELLKPVPPPFGRTFASDANAAMFTCSCKMRPVPPRFPTGGQVKVQLASNRLRKNDHEDPLLIYLNQPAPSALHPKRFRSRTEHIFNRLF